MANDKQELNFNGCMDGFEFRGHFSGTCFVKLDRLQLRQFGGRCYIYLAFLFDSHGRRDTIVADSSLVYVVDGEVGKEIKSLIYFYLMGVSYVLSRRNNSH